MGVVQKLQTLYHSCAAHVKRPKLHDKQMTLSARDGGIEQHVRSLALELGWSDAVIAHAIAADGDSYENECVIDVIGGIELRCPAYPEPCSYVRVLQAGFEIGYWTAEEWQRDPEDVMGALLGAAARGQSRERRLSDQPERGERHAG